MKRQTLFARGDGGYSAFRIPTILTLSSGRVLVFCEGRRDGLGDSGRILVRPSGTEALIRVMAEAKTEAEARNCAQSLADTIKSLKF